VTPLGPSVHACIHVACALVGQCGGLWAVYKNSPLQALPDSFFQQHRLPTLSTQFITDHPNKHTSHPLTLPPPQTIIMFGFGEGQQQYDQVYNQDQGDQNDDQNQGKFSHELIAGGASFAAMKVFEDRQRAEGMLHITLCESFLVPID